MPIEWITTHTRAEARLGEYIMRICVVEPRVRIALYLRDEGMSEEVPMGRMAYWVGRYMRAYAKLAPDARLPRHEDI
jgi:hypothetical protein